MTKRAFQYGDYCRRGHRLTVESVRFGKRPDGTPQRICKRCEYVLEKLRYRKRALGWTEERYQRALRETKVVGTVNG